MSSLHCCRACLGAEVSEAMEKAFAVVLVGRKIFALSCRWRPYRVESTRSLPTFEVKQPRAQGPCQGFEQGLNKVSSFQAVPTQDPPSHAYPCHFQSAFCPTLPTPPMPGASKWRHLLVLPQGMSNPGRSMGGLYVATTLQAP